MKKLFTGVLLAFVFVSFSPAVNAAENGSTVQIHPKHHRHHHRRHWHRHHHHHRKVVIIKR